MVKKYMFAGFSMMLSLGSLFAQDAYELVSRVITDPSYTYTASPDDWRDINVYQLFTDRFFDGDASNNNARSMRDGYWWESNTSYTGGNNVTNGRSWYNTSGSAQSNDRHLFQGGDWEGIRQKIPYFQEMGVNCIWLSSVNKVEQGVDKRFTPYHAYHPTDLYRCEPMFGDFAKLKQLIDELHAAGIYVILDVVPNHMADLIRRNGGDESYAAGCSSGDISWVEGGLTHATPFDNLDWFHCNGNIGDYDAYPENQLGGFRGTDDIATERADVQSALDAAFKNLISATDCDGFRVDALKHVDQTWIKNWTTSMRNHAASLGKNDFICFGELFSFDDGYHRQFTVDNGSGFNSAMWFTMMNTLKSVFKDGGATSNLTGQLDGIHNGDIFGNEADVRTIAFIDNHDVDRVSKNQPLWADMLRPAMGLLYCATPVPAIYYGTEHGFNQGDANNNPGADDGDYQRECMWDFGYQWGNADGDKFAETSEIKTLIGQLNAARADYNCLTRGSFTQRWETGGEGIYAFTRTLGDQEALVILNTHWTNSESATPAVSKADGTVYTNYLNPSETVAVSGGTLNITVPKKGLKVFIANAPGGGFAISNIRNWPLNGSVNSSDIVYIDADVTPKGDASSGQVEYSTDGGTTWTSVALARNAPFDSGTTDAWNANIGTFAAGTTVHYRVSFVDSGSNTVTDDNSGANYTFTVNSGAGGFAMDGVVDSDNYLVVDNGMRIWAAVRGTKLYFATWSSEGGTSDHFLLCTDKFGNPETHPWTKPGQINFWFAGWPWLAAEGDNDYAGINNGGASGNFAEGANGQVLEGSIDLIEVFGAVPDEVYLTALAYGTGTTDSIISAAPASWDGNDDVDVMEMAPIHIESIRDEDADGYFDAGNPTMESVVGGATADANYGLRRFFIDEVAGDSYNMTINFTPNVNPGEAVTGVELITNLNRRDKAVIQEDLNTVTTSSDTYYRAYAMTETSGVWSATVAATTCGVYRVNVRYYVDGNGPYYYTDNGQRRDLAVVVSPSKVLDVNIYEVNPAVVEATDDTFAGRSTLRDLWMANTDRLDAINTQSLNDLGVNMLWFQPIHPIGIEGRGTDPATSLPYEPGSPYACRDYWSINPSLGASNTESGALTEFQTMVTEFDNNGIGIMMDGTFNHSSPDVILGQGAADLFPWVSDSSNEIRNIRPGWYSRDADGLGGPLVPNYIEQATTAAEIAAAPDRFDFGKWNDTREFYFGEYDALVAYNSNSHRSAYLMERDDVEPLNSEAQEVWEYFAYYPIYWLNKSGHPAGTAASDSYKGIDGLRCDFAQGLPNEFWEHCINKTRSLKWDFIFMAESLDGLREVNGSKRHGVGYRSARQFDILNENIIYKWRDEFYGYAHGGAGSGNGSATKSTSNIKSWYDERKEAFEGVVVLNNLVSHDDVFPSDDPYEVLHGYAHLAAIKGVPMIYQGQEAGAQNSATGYAHTGGILNNDHNWTHYEDNFNKFVVHFKKWNDMTNVWTNRDTTLEGYYARLNQARLSNRALRGDGEYYLSQTGGGGTNEDIFAVARYETAGTDVASQNVVFAFVNNDPLTNPTVGATYDLSAEVSPGVNWFGIQPLGSYNIVNLLADDPTAYVWPSNKSGTDLTTNGITVLLDQPMNTLGQAQYLRLVDVNATNNDVDGDTLPDDWETSVGLSADPTTGANSPNGANDDPDRDGMTNYEEYLAGTNPLDPSSLLCISDISVSGTVITVTWDSTATKNYKLQISPDLATWTDADVVGDADDVVPAVGASTSADVDLGSPFPARYFARVVIVP